MFGKLTLIDLVLDLKEASFKCKGVKDNINAKCAKTASTYGEMLELSIWKQTAKLKLESIKREVYKEEALKQFRSNLNLKQINML